MAGRPPNPERCLAMIRAFEAGDKSMTEIGADFGVTKQAVWQVLMRYGVIIPVNGAPRVKDEEIRTVSQRRKDAEEGSRNLLLAYIAYFERHVWRDAA